MSWLLPQIFFFLGLRLPGLGCGFSTDLNQDIGKVLEEDLLLSADLKIGCQIDEILVAEDSLETSRHEGNWRAKKGL